jgi:hypothetical protein
VADEPSKGHKGQAVGVIGALAAIASIWWFALRPRGRRAEGIVDAGADEADD